MDVARHRRLARQTQRATSRRNVRYILCIAVASEWVNEWVKPGLHYPRLRPEFTGVKNAPEFTGRQLGCQKMHPSSRAVNSAREIGPWTRVVETGLKQTLMFYSTHSSSFRNSVNTFCWLKVSKHSNWMKQTAATTDQWLLGQSDTSNSLWRVLELTIVVPYVHIHNKFFKISDFPPKRNIRIIRIIGSYQL